MGKYMRKAKLTGDVVAVMEISQSSLGVRTRAKTLALQKLQASLTPTPPPPPPPSPAVEQRPELSYLQLRSRRLEKPPFQQLTCCRQQNPNPSLVNTSTETQIKADEETDESYYFGAEEASFGENNIDFDGRERSTRENTPCSSIQDFNVISTPGSSTRRRNLDTSTRIPVTKSIPLAQEIEEFFARHEHEQQKRFADKYNFDFVKENPLDGCYEWVRVESQ